MITIKSFQTKYLLKENIKKILEIKNENWKYGLNSQKKFFIKNILPDDYHVLLFFKKKLIGYTAFRERKIILNEFRQNYLLLDTITVSKKYRRKNFTEKLMKFNVNLIKKSKISCFLFCNKAKTRFFKKYQWKILPKSRFKVEDKTSKKHCMYFNTKFKKGKTIKIFINKA